MNTQKNRKYINYFLIIMLVGFTGCQDKVFETYELNNPVYLSYDELREAVNDTLPINLEHPGKIYIKGNYLFVNEVRKGIHVVDNSNPASPVVLRFIDIPGNIDLAVKDNILYADSYVDLITLDISDLSDIKEIGRIEDVFSYSLPPYETQQRLGEVDQSQGVVVGWKTEKVTREVTEPISYSWPLRRWETMDVMATQILVPNPEEVALQVPEVQWQGSLFMTIFCMLLTILHCIFSMSVNLRLPWQLEITR